VKPAQDSRSIIPAALVALISLGLAACGSVDLVATTNIPTPLVTKVPVTVALHVPKEFAEYVYKEERWSTDWNVNLGKAQADGITRLMNAMFEHVVVVDSVNAGAQLGGDVRAILEPSVEEYAFVTPRDAGSQFYAVSIKYRVNIYSPDGRLADSWGFTGYGTSPAQGLSSSEPLAQATALALRDAGAKLAVEFREQAIVRGLMPSTEPATAPEAAPPAGEPPAAAPTEQPTPAAAPAEAPEETPVPSDETKPAAESEPKPATSPPASSPQSLAGVPAEVETPAGGAQ
jgi:hypothetical protein